MNNLHLNNVAMVTKLLSNKHYQWEWNVDTCRQQQYIGDRL